VGPENHLLDGGPDPPWEGAILSGERAVLGHSVVICAKMAEPIKIPFGLWARMGPRNYVLDGVLDPHGKGQFSGKGQFWGKGAAHCKVYRDTLRSPVRKQLN